MDFFLPLQVLLTRREVNGINFGVKPPELREYKTVKYDFYGMARVGGTWRGVRMVYEK